MYGGLGTTDGGYEFLGDVWIGWRRDEGSIEWRQIESSAPPGRRCIGASIFDEENKRMIVVGGTRSDGVHDMSVWALDLSEPYPFTPQWTKLTPAGVPPEWRSFPMAIYDPVKTRMVMFGGYKAPIPIVPDNDVHVLYLEKGAERWEHYKLEGAPEECIYVGRIAYYPQRRWLLVVANGFEGCVDEEGHPKVWALYLDGF